MSLLAVSKTLPHGLRVDRRDVREGLEVAIPFRIRCGDRLLEGLRLSPAHLVIEDQGRNELSLTDAMDLSLHLGLSGTELTLQLTAVTAPREASEPGSRRLDIVTIDPDAAATLEQFVRIAATGWLPRAEDLAKRWDSETPLSPQGSGPGQGRVLPWVILFASAILLIAGLGFIGHDAYGNFTTIHAQTAAISAPRTDVFSHEYGTVAANIAGVGTSVRPGQFLARVNSEDLKAQIEIESANLADLESDSLGASLRRREIVQSRIAALERRQRALSYEARCYCKVLWSAPAGAPVAPGTLLMSLVAAKADEIRVEALVTPRDALEIVPGRKAQVTPAGFAGGRRAHVEAVKYEFVPAPKVGLGKRAEGLVTVVLVVEEAVEELVPGTPADVFIWK